MRIQFLLPTAALLALSAGTSLAQSTYQRTARIASGTEVRARSFAFQNAGARRGPVPTRVAFELFDGVRQFARLSSFDVTRTDGLTDGFTWYGRLESDRLGYLALAYRNGALAGTILHDGAVHTLRGTSFQDLVLAEVATHALAECDNEDAYSAPLRSAPGDGGQVSMQAGPRTARRPLTGNPPTMAEANPTPVSGPTRIDVLVVWTQEAEDAAGGSVAMEALIDLAMLETHQAYDNSGVDISLRLVGRSKVAYVESGSMATDLYRLRATQDPFLNEVHQMRNQSGADVVSMFVANDTKAGRSFNYGVLPSEESFAESAFNLVSQGSATGVFAFGHELGHNFGLDHDRPNTKNTPSLPFAYGTWLADDTHRTIMSLERPPNAGIRIPYYSNPSMSYLGLSLGVPDPQPDSSDCARALNLNAATIAGWRSERVPLRTSGNSRRSNQRRMPE